MNKSEILINELNKKGRLVLRVNGGSMEPFLHNGTDFVVIEKAEKVKTGDVVFFCGPFGRPVLHRIIRIEDGLYYMCGDANNTGEPPVERDRIFGIATHVIRDGRIKEISALTTGCYTMLSDVRKAFHSVSSRVSRKAS